MGKLICCALACDITLPVIGCATPEEVSILARTPELKPLSEIEKKFLEDQFKPYATRLAFYRGNTIEL